MQDTKGNLYLLKNWISDALELNRQICYILSEINGTDDLYQCTKMVDLELQGNCKMLLLPKLIEKKSILMYIPNLSNRGLINGLN